MRKARGTIAISIFGWLVALSAAAQAPAQDVKTPYPRMAPPEQYLMERNAEVALARSAAPPSIAQDAEVMVLGSHGYEIAVRGKNGFVCMVQRSWAAGIDDPDFWNPKLRSPACFNAPAARSYVVLLIKKTELVLAGRSRTQMFEAISAAIDNKALPRVEPGAMCYMMSKQGYLSDRDGRWHPHVMLFVPPTDPETWGVGSRGSPIIAFKDDQDRLTVFLIPVRTWSDGTADVVDGR